jgi:hypothetical protein
MMKYLGVCYVQYFALILLCTGCSELPPRARLSLAPGARSSAAFETHPMQVSVCDDSFSPQGVAPILLMMSNHSITAWTVDAGQISVCRGHAGRCYDGSPSWLPLPADEAARMSPIPLSEGMGEIIEEGGLVATYLAGIGAAGGAFAAYAKGQDESNGFSLGASFGAIIGGFAGSMFEWARLSFVHESKDAGDANEKMKFLALNDRSVLYTDYTSVGYVYFPGQMKHDSADEFTITIPFVRGDPSKDWVTPPNYRFPAEPVYPERYLEVDESPLVCECRIQLPSANCDELFSQGKMMPRLLQRVPLCEAAGHRVDTRNSCGEIASDGVLEAAGGGPATSMMLPKWHWP